MFFEEFIGPLVKRVMRALGIRDEKSLKAIMDSGQIELPFEIKDGKGELFEDIEDSAAIALWREISNGDTCKVVFDGKEYILPATVGPSSENPADTDIHIGGDGYPFYFWHTIAESNANMIFFIEAYDEKPGHSFAVYLQTEKTTPISDKYLPGVCLPVVELTSVKGITGNDYALTQAEGEQLDKAAQTNLPCVITFSMEGMTISVICEHMVTQGDHVFICTSGMTTAQVGCSDGVWSASLTLNG